MPGSWPPADSRRERVYKLRLTDAEAEQFEQRAQLARRSNAEFLRMVVLGLIERSPEPQREAALR